MIAIARPILSPQEQEAVLRVLASGQLAQGEQAAAEVLKQDAWYDRLVISNPVDKYVFVVWMKRPAGPLPEDLGTVIYRI